MPLQLVTAATITPFTLEEAKDYLHIFNNDDDFYIQTLIDAVVSIAENITNRSIYTTTWKLIEDRFCSFKIEIPKGNLQSVTHVKYYDTNGDQQTIDAANYQVDTVSQVGRVIPISSYYWPTTEGGRINSVEIQFVAGWTKRNLIPKQLRQALFHTLSHYYEMREPFIIGATVTEVPMTITKLYSDYRLRKFY